MSLWVEDHQLQFDIREVTFKRIFKMKGFFTLCTLFVVALAVADVFSQEHEYEHVATAEVAHHRAKRSPYDPTLPLILGKTFLLGSVLGPKLFSKGWGPPRHHGWGWSYPSKGWGWSSPPVVTVSHGWGWH